MVLLVMFEPRTFQRKAWSPHVILCTWLLAFFVGVSTRPQCPYTVCSGAQGLHVKLHEPQWQSTLLCQPLYTFTGVMTRLAQDQFRSSFSLLFLGQSWPNLHETGVRKGGDLKANSDVCVCVFFKCGPYLLHILGCKWLMGLKSFGNWSSKW